MTIPSIPVQQQQQQQQQSKPKLTYNKSRRKQKYGRYPRPGITGKTDSKRSKYLPVKRQPAAASTKKKSTKKNSNSELEKQKRSSQRQVAYQKNIIAYKDKLLLSKNKQIAQLSKFKLRVEEVDERTHQSRQKSKKELHKERAMHSLLMKEAKQSSEKREKKNGGDCKEGTQTKRSRLCE